MKQAIVCATHVIWLAVIRSLGELGIPIYAVYYDKKDMGYVSRYVKKAIHVADPVSNEKQFIEDILKIEDCATGGMVIPADDATVTAISRNKIKLESRYVVAMVSETEMDRFIDKSITYEIANQLGIPIPATYKVSSLNEAISSAKHLLPCLVKPCKSHLYYEKFKCKMVLVHTEEELKKAFNEARSASLEVMIQEYIEGDDTCGYNYNSYFCDGKPIAEFTAEKIRLSPPQFGIPSAVRAKEINDIIDLGRRIVIGLGIEGYSCTEFKFDKKTNTYKLMEVNGRHNRSALLAFKCGLNFPWIEYEHRINSKIPEIPLYKKSEQVWIDEFRDVFTSFHKMIRGKMSPWSFIKPYLSNPVFAVFNFRDPMPFFKRISGFFG